MHSVVVDLTWQSHSLDQDPIRFEDASKHLPKSWHNWVVHMDQVEGLQRSHDLSDMIREPQQQLELERYPVPFLVQDLSLDHDENPGLMAVGKLHLVE